MKLSQTVVNFAVPASFYGQIPNSPTGTCTLTCVTWQGTTQIGTKTAKFTVTAAKNLCLPDVSLTAVDIWEKTCQLTGNPNVLVLNASAAKCKLTATAKNSATITKRTLLGQTVAAESELKPVTTATITYSATDSY